MSYFILSILLAFWFQYEFKRFPKQINLQTYQDFCSLYPLDLSENEFLEKSNMQHKDRLSLILFILLPLLSIICNSQSIILLLIVLCLGYLSILDYSYYLTDIKYLGLILSLSLLHSISDNLYFIQDKIITFLSTTLFFTLFFYLTKWLFKKEVFGLGDILLIISLSPLFFIEQLLYLLLISSLSGIIFSIFYFIYYKKKLKRLAFIPFISLSYIIIFNMNSLKCF